KCHGPDNSARKGKLRLDVRDSALKGGSSGDAAIVPGKPDESEVVRRITSTAEDDVMPPPAAKMPLAPEHKELLKRWIREGAVYKDHWAFVPPAQRPVPVIRYEPSADHNPIDAFVIARLEKASLKPSPQADRYTLVR